MRGRLRILTTVGRRRSRWFIAFAVLAGCSTSIAPTEASCPPSPFRSETPLVIAHAGGSILAPGNTMYALERAVDVGADILDLDVRMTSDGVIVARHDRDLSTTTDGSGPVDQATWAEVSQLDAAHLWAGDSSEHDIGVARLDEALAQFPDHQFSIEIKQTNPSMAQQMCDQLVASGDVDRVFVSSNADNAVYAFQTSCVDAVITTTYRDLDDQRDAEAQGEVLCSASPIGQPPYRITGFDELLEGAHDRGAAIFTWTVNDPDDLRRLAELGVDAVYTDRPDLAREIFDEVAAR